METIPNLFEQDTDLLSQIDAIEIDNTERISSSDKEFCTRIQTFCHQALQQLQSTYEKMVEDSREYIEEGIVKIEYGDTYNHPYGVWMIDDKEKKYKYKHYVPCLNEKTVRKLFTETCRMFATDIIGYFNNTYGVNIDDSDLYRDVSSIKDFNPSFRPRYEDLVDVVIAHLGGRTFSQTMEDEVYANAVKEYEKDWIEIKGSSVIIDHFIHSSMFSMELDYESRNKVIRIYDALSLMFTGIKSSLNINQFLKVNGDPEQGKSYECILPEIKHFRFYKNNKMEIRFINPSDAQKFHDRIKIKNS